MNPGLLDIACDVSLVAAWFALATFAVFNLFHFP